LWADDGDVDAHVPVRRPVTQGGLGEAPLTGSDILGPSEAFRQSIDYFAHSPDAHDILERLALEQPTTLACMHGSAYSGDGAALLRGLAQRLAEKRADVA